MKINGDFTTQSAIDTSIIALKNGINEAYLRLAMRDDGFTEKRIETILRWAKKALETE